MSKRFAITFQIGPDGMRLQAFGRNGWALLELVGAGDRGITPITVPGPRWSAYVHNLRRMGVHIETIHESHAGPFPGSHARYVLKSPIFIIAKESQRGKAV